MKRGSPGKFVRTRPNLIMQKKRVHMKEKMKNEILRFLQESREQYVSGQQLCEKLEVSRTAVWKNIKKLKEEGYEIEAVSNRGYRLVSCPDILSEWEITHKLDTKYLGRVTEFHEVVDSTNNRETP